MNNEKLTNNVYKKINNELLEYMKEIKKLSPDEIIKKSYETTCKEEFVDMFYNADGDYETEELIALLEKENTLDFLFNDWMASDGGIHSLLEDNMQTTLQEIVDERRRTFAKDHPELINKITNTLDELNNYNFCDYLKDYFDIVEINNFEIEKIISNGGGEYLLDFFKDIKNNKQLKYLVEINTFNSNNYNDITTSIIPKLNELTTGKKSNTIYKERDQER